MRIRGPLLGVYRRAGLWGLGALGPQVLASETTIFSGKIAIFSRTITIFSRKIAIFSIGKSPFLVGDTSSNGWKFSIVIPDPSKVVSMV